MQVLVVYKGRQAKVPCTPGTLINEIKAHGCKTLGMDPEAYDLKKGKTIVNGGLPFRLANIVANAKLELTPRKAGTGAAGLRSSPVSSAKVKLHVSDLPSDFSSALIGEFDSTTTLWGILQYFEQKSGINLTQRRSAADSTNKDEGFYEMPTIDLLGRVFSKPRELDATIGQLGLQGGSVLMKVRFVTMRSGDLDSVRGPSIQQNSDSTLPMATGKDDSSASTNPAPKAAVVAPVVATPTPIAFNPVTCDEAMDTDGSVSTLRATEPADGLETIPGSLPNEHGSQVPTSALDSIAPNNVNNQNHSQMQNNLGPTNPTRYAQPNIVTAEDATDASIASLPPSGNNSECSSMSEVGGDMQSRRSVSLEASTAGTAADTTTVGGAPPIRVYLPSSHDRVIPHSTEMDNDASHMSKDQFIRYQSQIKAMAEGGRGAGGPLLTKALRQKAEAAQLEKRQARVKQCAIRIRLPDGTCIETVFSPSDTGEAVISFMRSVMVNPSMAFRLIVVTPERREIRPQERLVKDMGFGQRNVVHFEWLRDQSEGGLSKEPILKQDFLQRATSISDAPEIKRDQDMSGSASTGGESTALASASTSESAKKPKSTFSGTPKWLKLGKK